MKLTTKLWIGLGILIVLSPLGLFLPEHFKAGAAWGEWGVREVQELVGYVPRGLEKLSSFWNAPLADYALKGQEGGSSQLSLAYIVSAVVGIFITVVIVLLIGEILVKKGDK
jgi:hypothetical protein